MIDQSSITTFLAVWGAILGTIGTVISLILVRRDMHKDHHQIQISMEISKNDPFWVIDGMDRKSYLIVIVHNSGFRPTQVRTVRILLSDGKFVNIGKMTKGDFPQLLEESMSVDVYFDLSELREAIKSSTVYLKSIIVSDATGNSWKRSVPKTIRQMI
ncbi:MAG: hypothetical protein NT121_20010 [Chloroflexi bacterium]|nr:hypothetical protein [Chloroflexota bacterium]